MSLDPWPYTSPDQPAAQPAFPLQPATNFEQFVVDSGNRDFRRSVFTWASLLVLLGIYPGMSLLGLGEDPLELLRSLDQTMLFILLLTTVIFQWGISLINYIALYQEKTGLAGVGLTRIRLVDLLWGVAFLLAANVILAGLAWGLGQVGLPMPGEVGLLIPKDPLGKGLWVVVAATAGFCEEVAFRGYLMTRLRLLGKFQSWVIPTVISALAFGVCHLYQGIPGLIVITVYGVLFSLLYIRTGRLWPCVIAHFLQDFGGLFFPQ